MQPFTRVTGAAAPLPAPNCDTDVIMPKQFLTGIDRQGLDKGVFFHLRFDADGRPAPDFILNRPEWRDAAFLVVGPNFGCGSSREHAVWGLAQLGVRALIGSSFAGIFADNCFRNGILTVILPPAEIERLFALVGTAATNRLTVDLAAQTVAAEDGGPAIGFEIDALRKEALLRGEDAVGATLRHADDIRAFERAYRVDRPWLDYGRARPAAHPLLPGFTSRDIETGGARIRLAAAGSGPPVLLLHGHPQTHLTWHKIAGGLVEAGHTVVATDLRGYGDSSKPPGGERHVDYSKREMARDQVEVMRSLGFDRFAVVGHDRGGRVAHRLALDHPGAVERLALFDIAPTATMYARTDKEFATRYFWWFFLIQPYDMPERMIGSDPEYFLRKHLAGQSKIPGSTPEELVQEYLRCYRDPATIHAICEDYRAAATIDLDHDAADADRRVTAPLLALWGARGTVGALYDVLETWREKATDVRGHALDCGHSPQEEAPAETLAELRAFLKG